ncbi:MAG: hypothetical protein J2P57_00380 [Acidimicrobiaceae bacterium]|nr:hypothetical protein [Acidimicrobiaceae bacterium]
MSTGSDTRRDYDTREASTTASWRDWSCAVFIRVTDARNLAGATVAVRDVMARVEMAVSRFRDDSDVV